MTQGYRGYLEQMVTVHSQHLADEFLTCSFHCYNLKILVERKKMTNFGIIFKSNLLVIAICLFLFCRYTQLKDLLFLKLKSMSKLCKISVKFVCSNSTLLRSFMNRIYSLLSGKYLYFRLPKNPDLNPGLIYVFWQNQGKH